MRDSAKIVVADVGGTTIKLGLVSGGKLLAMEVFAAEAGLSMTERLEAIAQGWERLAKRGGLNLNRLGGAALALPFLIDADGTRALGDFDKFPGADEINYSEWASKRLGLPLVMENDLRMALLGEWRYGAARGWSDVVMLALGTGIGCAVICGGQMIRGARNQAGAVFGHMTVAMDEPPGRCGNLGCAEDLASTATLSELARQQPGFEKSALGESGDLNFERVFELSDAGDECAGRLLEHCLKVWSVVAFNAVLAYDPAILVLGGGILRRRETVLPAIRNHLIRRVAGVCRDIPVVGGSLEDRAALLGGECFFRNKVHDL